MLNYQKNQSQKINSKSVETQHILQSRINLFANMPVLKERKSSRWIIGSKRIQYRRNTKMTAAIPLSQVHISEKNKFDEGIKSIPIEDIETLP